MSNELTGAISFYFRLVSAFINKINPGNTYYHNKYGKEIIFKYRKNATQESLQRGHDVTFSEFINYVVDLPGKYDAHWRPQYKISFPCIVNYKYIGKFETLHEDMRYLLQKIYGLNNTRNHPAFQKVKTTNKAVIAKYYETIPKYHIDKLISIYKFDFMLFNYSTVVPESQS